MSRGYSPMHPGCNPVCLRLQPCVLEAATPRAQVLDAHNYDASIKLGGTILRRQLLLLLKVASSGCIILA